MSIHEQEVEVAMLSAAILSVSDSDEVEVSGVADCLGASFEVSGKPFTVCLKFPGMGRSRFGLMLRQDFGSRHKELFGDDAATAINHLTYLLRLLGGLPAEPDERAESQKAGFCCWRIVGRKLGLSV